MVFRNYFVYITTNKINSVLYTGVTNSLERRAYEHKIKINKRSFTSRYNVNKLVYYEAYDNVEDAIRREKQIKAGSRKKKIEWIESINPEWEDLFDKIGS